VDATAYLALEHNQLTPGAAFSASSRLFDLKIEASRFRKKNISAAIVADVKRFCYAIKADEVFMHGNIVVLGTGGAFPVTVALASCLPPLNDYEDQRS
jgi:hypothetical protein